MGKRGYILIILFVLLYANNVSVFAQISCANNDIYASYISSIHYSFDKIVTEDGLAQSSVVCMTKDSYGFMWFGTYHGVSMFNGINFTNYSNIDNDSNSLSGNMIWAMCEDDDKNMWFGTFGKGLNKFDITTEKFKHYFPKDGNPKSLSGKIIRALYKTDNHDIWIGTENGLSRYNKATDNFTNFPIYPPYADNTVTSLYQDTKGVLWIGTNEGVISFDIKKGKIIQSFKHNAIYTDSIGFGSVISIVEDKNGNMWFGTWGGGLNMYDTENNRFTTYTAKETYTNSISNNVITSLAIDNTQRMWIGTRGGGIDIYDFDRRSFHNVKNEFTDRESISANTIYSIYCDNSNIVWVGTDFGGINKYDNSRACFRSIRYSPLPDAKIHFQLPTYLFEDSYCQLWIGGRGGCSVYNRAENKSTFLPFYYNGNKFTEGPITSIQEDADGSMWIGSDGGGILRYYPKSEQSVYYIPINGDSSCIGDNVINTILIDKENTVWIGTFNWGLYKYDREKNAFIHIPIPTLDNSKSVCIKTLIEDSYGNIIIGSPNTGLVFYNKSTGLITKREHNKHNKYSISENYANVLFEDRDSTLWLGIMDRGINKFNRLKNEFSRFTTSQRLSNNRVYGILQDNDGDLWISTEKGLNKFNLRTQTIEQYYKSNGLLNDEFQNNSFVKCRNGDFIYGTYGGLIIFNPKDVVFDYPIPKITLTDIKLFNNSLEPNIAQDDGTVILTKPARLTTHIELSYFDNIVTFNFAVLHYSSPKENQYAYKLEGFDQKWNITSSNSVTYTNLNPGTYTLMIRGAGNNLVWNNDPLKITIVIHPPMWGTWWFISGCIVLIILLIALIYRFRVRQLRRRSLLLEKTVTVRTKEIAAMNQELLSKTNALEFSNELLKIRQEYIEAQSNELQKQKKTLEESNVSLNISNETKDKLFSIISHDLRNPFSNIMGFSDLMVMRFEHLEKEKMLDFAKKINSSSKKVYNLLENLLLWARAQQNGIQMRATVLNVKNVINYAIALFNESAKDKNIVIKNLSPVVDLTIEADNEMLITVIRNILNNAIKFTPQNGIITILYERKATDVHIRISDTGIGIPISVQHILRNSESITTTGTQHEKGTGLGLQLCRDFIACHNGKIWFDSEENKGTTFHILLPISIA